MPLNKLKRNFEERRFNLIETLQKNKEQMELSKQHQLYGAIKEIESFLKAIDLYREEQLNTADFELKRAGKEPLSDRATEAMQQLGKNTKGFFGNVAVGFNEKVIKSTGRAVKRTSHKVKLFKQVMREVKERTTAQPPVVDEGKHDEDGERKDF